MPNLTILMSRYAMTIWMFHHPWSFLVGPAVLVTVYLVSKIRNR